MKSPSRRALLSLMAWTCLAAPMVVAQQAGPGLKALELNTANRAQLESLRGLGPGLVERLLLARQQGEFHSWTELRQRVRGIGPALAQQLSSQGLRVAGQAWDPNVNPFAASGPVSALTPTQ